ncbi:hypothetical protein AMTRI_Chr04g251770 [Amborella trichopoda]
MGNSKIEGTLEYFSDLLSRTQKKKKKKQFQTVDLKVTMDCEGCENKVRKAVSSLKGVKSVETSRKDKRVSVTGYVEAKKVLKRVQDTGKKAEFWPYVPYNLVAHPYAPQAYDKKAPAGYVRNVESIVPTNSDDKQEEKMTSMFSDDNPNACSIM